ncbi:MAG TPA: cytochrome c oxidase subunit II [Candidatus Binataceae bacterium]|nr:cytochrome c oxidase subunit II [Candidatus Binataceae bacterium]
MSGVPTLNPVSPEAASISHLFIAILFVMLAIFLLVAALVTVAIIRYRDCEGAPEARQEFGNPRLEIIWTVIPALLLAVIFVFTVRTIHASDPPIAGYPPDLRVIGHQWWWEADYLGSGVVAANEIHIPVGRQILVEVESADVIHDFWVPELGRKIDAVPGHPNHIWIRADKPGVYLGTCAEFCGNQHAWMRIMVVAQPPAEFAAWQRDQLAVPAVPESGVAAQGARIFREETCINCHAISGTTGNQRIGPDLTHLAGRRIIAAGAAENTSANLFKWLKDPDSIKPETHMPNFQLSDAQAHALVAYLETLK